MDVEDEIREKMKKYDLVLVYPNNFVSKIAIFLSKLVFPSIKYNPLAPVFGYRGEIYGKEKDLNLAKILINEEYERAYVIHKKLEYNPKRIKDIMEFFHKYQGVRMIIKYAITSAAGILLNMFFFFLLYKVLKIYDMFSLTIAIELSIIITFFMHNNWVFSTRVYTKPLWRRFLGYHFILISGMLINLGSYYALALLKVNYLLADFVGIVLAGIWSLYMVDVHVFFAKYQKVE